MKKSPNKGQERALEQIFQSIAQKGGILPYQGRQFGSFSFRASRMDSQASEGAASSKKLIAQAGAIATACRFTSSRVASSKR